MPPEWRGCLSGDIASGELCDPSRLPPGCGRIGISQRKAVTDSGEVGDDHPQSSRTELTQDEAKEEGPDVPVQLRPAVFEYQYFENPGEEYREPGVGDRPAKPQRHADGVDWKGESYGVSKDGQTSVQIDLRDEIEVAVQAVDGIDRKRDQESSPHYRAVKKWGEKPRSLIAHLQRQGRQGEEQPLALHPLLAQHDQETEGDEVDGQRR